jgi:hypothetical protein
VPEADAGEADDVAVIHAKGAHDPLARRRRASAGRHRFDQLSGQGRPGAPQQGAKVARAGGFGSSPCGAS